MPGMQRVVYALGYTLPQSLLQPFIVYCLAPCLAGLKVGHIC